MTLDDIIDRIEHIRSCTRDDEAAHSAEDGLYHAFIEYVAAAGEDDPEIALKAQTILETDNIDFARHCS